MGTLIDKMLVNRLTPSRKIHVHFLVILRNTSTLACAMFSSIATRVPLKFPAKNPAVFPRSRYSPTASGIYGTSRTSRNFCVGAAASNVSSKYPKVGAKTTGTIPDSHLIEVVEAAARTGAQVLNVDLGHVCPCSSFVVLDFGGIWFFGYS